MVAAEETDRDPFLSEGSGREELSRDGEGEAEGDSGRGKEGDKEGEGGSGEEGDRAETGEGERKVCNVGKTG